MPSMTPESRRIRFAKFEADLQSQELFYAGTVVRLPNQSFTALAMLLERPGELVSRDELRARLWPGNRVVEFEQGLNAVINRLREALGDSAGQPKYIETLPRRGYRFIGQLTVAASHEPAEAQQPALAQAAAPAHSPVSHSTRRWGWWLGLAAVTVAIFAAVARWVYEPKPLLASGAVPLTTLLGEERMPDFSPDGQRVVFAWNGDAGESGFDLYLKALDSERLTRLTNSPATAISASWSPDGTRIAFTRESDGAGGGLFLIPATGGDARKLADASFTQESLMHPAWSPDGATLAYPAMNESGSQVVRLLKVDGAQERPLEPAPPCRDAGAPTWSGDGKQLAFVCMTSVAVYEVYLANPDTNVAPRKIATMQGFPQGLAWVPDADRILIANESGNGSGVWELELDGSLHAPRALEEAVGPGITARAGKAAFTRARQIIDIWHLDLAPGAVPVPRKWISSTRAQITPQYSPDGTRIAFQSNRSGSPEIWIADADGRNAARLTSFGGPLTGAPAWCSDGRRLAFDARESGASAVYVIDTLERVPRKVATPQTNLALPVWSADCRWLLASDGRNSLYRVPSDGGEAHRFTSLDSYQAAVIGDRVVFNVTEADGVTLWVKPLLGGEETRIPGLPRLAYADSWAATEQSIYFTDSTWVPVALRRYDFATASTPFATEIAQPTALGGLGLAVSRDGKSVLFTHTEDTQSDLVLTGPEP
jgi:Tol biopolymer transport system component/DNA-binding winged helix-turn-helix (wHTH) protein